MPQERLSVTKIREVIRLHYEAGISNRAAARAYRVSNSTVGEYLERAEKAGLTWPLPEDLSEEELYRRLYPEEKSPGQPPSVPCQTGRKYSENYPSEG